VKPAESLVLCPYSPVNNVAFVPGSVPKMLFVCVCVCVLVAGCWNTRSIHQKLVTNLFVNYLVSSKQERATALHGFQLSQAQNKLSICTTNGTQYLSPSYKAKQQNTHYALKLLRHRNPRHVVQANGRFGVRLRLRRHGFDARIKTQSSLKNVGSTEKLDTAVCPQRPCTINK
jgi:hypothetical protein